MKKILAELIWLVDLDRLVRNNIGGERRLPGQQNLILLLNPLLNRYCIDLFYSLDWKNNRDTVMAY